MRRPPPPPPPLLDVVLVSIRIPSLKVITPLRPRPSALCRKAGRPSLFSFPHYDSAVADVAELSTVARTSHGRLRGTTEGGVNVWRGVAYAEQPVGSKGSTGDGRMKPDLVAPGAVEHGPLPPQGR